MEWIETRADGQKPRALVTALLLTRRRWPHLSTQAASVCREPVVCEMPCSSQEAFNKTISPPRGAYLED